MTIILTGGLLRQVRTERNRKPPGTWLSLTRLWPIERLYKHVTGASNKNWELTACHWCLLTARLRAGRKKIINWRIGRLLLTPDPAFYFSRFLWIRRLPLLWSSYYSWSSVQPLFICKRIIRRLNGKTRIILEEKFGNCQPLKEIE